MLLAPSPSQFQNLLLAPKLLRDPRKPISDLAARFGRIFRTRTMSATGLREMVWLLGAELNERILAPAFRDEFTWYEGYGFTMEPLLGRDILFLLDDQPEMGEEGAHRRRHRLLIPAFQPRLDSQYLPAMAEIIGQHLYKLPTGQPVDLAATVKQVTFHIVARLLFGMPIEDIERLLHDFEAVGLGLFSLVHLRIPGLPYYRADRARRKLAAYVHQKIQCYRRGEAPAPTFLSQLLDAEGEAGERLSDETLVSEMLSFLFAGYDTTASMLTSTVVALAENPQVRERLLTELAPLDVERLKDGALPELPYLDAVLLEVERLYPPLTFAMRGVLRDFEVGGYTVRRGDNVAYSAYFTGRDPELYKDPLRFDPDRFVGQKPRPYAMVGFGAGHRPCIGKRFSLLEMRLFVALLFRVFDVQFASAQSDAVFFNPTMQRRDGYFATLALRHRSASHQPNLRS